LYVAFLIPALDAAHRSAPQFPRITRGPYTIWKLVNKRARESDFGEII